MKKNKEILTRYESAFGKPAEIVCRRCFGKWAGTTDYSIKIGDSLLSVGNSTAGQDYLNQHIIDIVEVFEIFAKRKAEILQKIKSFHLREKNIIRPEDWPTRWWTLFFMDRDFQQNQKCILWRIKNDYFKFKRIK